MSSDKSLYLQKPCPTCHHFDTLKFNANTIKCTNSSCSFAVTFACPICNAALPDQIEFDSYGEYLSCQNCHHQIHIRRIQHLIQSGLIVDQSTRCRICNGPTLHRPNVNIGHRCYFFPKCSGQTSLFKPQKETLVFLDFETTGIEPTRNHIIEIGALKIDEEGFEHVFESFIKPPIPISPKITSITNITNEMVQDAPPINSVLPRFLEFIGSAKLIAHNTEFDIPWLLLNAIRLNLTIPCKDVICTMKWAKRLKEPSVGLGKLTKKYDISHQNAHRALADAVSTKEIFFIFDHHDSQSIPVEPIATYQSIVDKQLDYHQRTARFTTPSSSN